MRPLESFVGSAQSNGLLRCLAIRALLDTVENEMPESALERRRTRQHSDVPSEVLQDIHEIVEESHRRFNFEHHLYFSQPVDVRTFQTRARSSSRVSVELYSLVNGFFLSLRKKTTNAGLVVGLARIYSTVCLVLVIDGSERILMNDWENADNRVHCMLEERDTHQSGLATNIYLREQGDQIHRDSHHSVLQAERG